MDLPPILLGCSPFIGAGQFGAKAYYYYQKFYLQPKNMVKLFKKSFDLGVKSIQLLSDRPVDALIEASRTAGVNPFVIYSTDLSGVGLRRTLERLRSLEPEVIAVHAGIADSFDVNEIMKRIDIVREYGSIAGIATHRPGTTLPWIKEKRIPVEVILAPLNPIGYCMEPDFETSMKAIRECSHKIVAIKPLAAGRLAPREALNFVYSYVDNVAVGIASGEEMKETYDAADIAFKERKVRE
ncbi:MAG: hypothetical protein H3Z50_02310 [archaeon]|nr:hypothetical protein [archaeon]MCP8305804.1 hypothetical protein [archaeon]